MKKTFLALESIEAIGTKRNPKLEILNSNSQNNQLREIFRLTYDWMITFGIRQYNPRKERGIFNDVKNPGWGKAGLRWKYFRVLTAGLAARVLTGGEATREVERFFLSCTDLERKWYDRILQRDLRIGINTRTVQKVWPGLLSSWGVQLAEPLADHELDFPVMMDPKLDGLRLTVPIQNGIGIARTRSGREYPQLNHIVEILATVNSNAVFDGELFGGSWNATQKGLPRKPMHEMTPLAIKKMKDLCFHCFDYIPLKDFLGGGCRVPLSTRREHLERDFKTAKISGSTVSVLKRTVANSPEEVEQIYQEYLSEGHEGAMIKSLVGWYTPGGRNDDWLKFKPDTTIEALIVGYEKGTGRNSKRLGAFLVELEDETEARVGGGFSDKQRSRFWKKRKKLKGSVIEILVQKDFEEVATVRFPRFVRFREDIVWER